MLKVGIDAHWRHYVHCILNENGNRVKEYALKGGPADVAEQLRKLGEPFEVCYEASCGYGTLYDALKPIAARIVVAHPAQLRLIYRAKRKTDRIDAFKLAKLLHLDQVPAIHVPSLNVREWRVLIEHRRRLVDKRTATKNGLRSILRAQGLDMPRGRRLWSAKGVAWLKSLELSADAAFRRDQLIMELEHFDAMVRLAEARLDKIAEGSAGVALLRSIPGVGARTAEAMVAYVDDPHRFSSTRKAGSYFGLVPCLDESAGASRYGHITKEGPATVRKLLTEAAWHGIRRSPRLREFFERIRMGRKERRGVALIATTRHLVRIMVAMLKSGEAWRKEMPLPAKKAAQPEALKPAA